MAFLTLGASDRVLHNFVTKRRWLVEELSHGVAIYLPEAAELHADVVLTRNRVFQEQAHNPVPEMFSRHVTVTRSISLVLESQREDTGLDEAVRAAATRLHTLIVEGQRGPRPRVGERVEHALDVKRAQEMYREDLALMPAAAARQLNEWFSLSEALDDAISDRDGVEEDGTRSPRTLVRETSRFIAKLRRAARVEVEARPELGETFETKLFSYVEQAFAERRRSRTSTSDTRPQTETTREPERVIVDVNVDVDVGSAPPANAEPSQPDVADNADAPQADSANS